MIKSGENNTKAKKVKPYFDRTKENKNAVEDKSRAVKTNETHKEVSREIIRRLRIQNKKLIEQVVKLKEEIKKSKFIKSQVLIHIDELLAIISEKNTNNSG